MRIAFDATTLGPPQTGVGYYSEHLLKGLLRTQPDHRFLLLTHQPLTGRWRGMEASDSFVASRNLWLQWTAPRLLRRLRPEIAHFTNSLVPWLANCPMVVTVHDMSVSLFPRLHPLRRRLMFPLVTVSMQRARRVITVSDTSRRDIVSRGLDSAKVDVVHAAAAPQFRPIDDFAVLDRVRLRYRLPERFLLFVGTLEPRKNLGGLLKAYRGLPAKARRSCPLIIVGPPGWGMRRLTRDLRRGAWGAEIRWIGYVPFGDLPALQNLAEAFIFPSLYEGFGLPVIEAMASGTPVITSSGSSLKELFEDAALLVDPQDAVALTGAMQRVLESGDLRRELAQKGLVRARRFSWDKAAEQTLDVYRRAMN